MFPILCIQICQVLYQKYNGDRQKAREWLQNPLQNGNIPLYLIQSGHPEIVLQYLVNSTC